MLVLWKLTNSQGSVWNRLFREIMKIASRRRGFNSLTHENLVRKNYSHAKIQDAKAAVNKKMEDARKVASVELGKQEERCHAESTKREMESPLCYIDRHLSSQECAIGTEEPEIHKDESRSEEMLLKMTQGHTRYSQNKDRHLLQMTAEKVMDASHCEITTLRLTSRRRSISSHPGKNEDDPRLLKKFQSLNVQIYGYVVHDTNFPNLVQTSKTQWFFLEELCTATRLLASCGRDSFSRFRWNLLGWEIVPNWEKSFRLPNTRLNFCRFLLLTSKCLEDSRIWLPCGRN